MTAVIESRPVRTPAGRREFVALVVCSMAMGAMAIDIMLPAFPDMRAEFGMAADSARVGWIVTAFFLGMAIGPWLYGPASDRFGRCPLLLAGLGLCTPAGIAAVFAPTFGWVIVARPIAIGIFVFIACAAAMILLGTRAPASPTPSGPAPQDASTASTASTGSP